MLIRRLALWSVVIAALAVVVTVLVAWICRNLPVHGAVELVQVVYTIPDGREVFASEFTMRPGVMSRHMLYDPAVQFPAESARRRAPGWSLASSLASRTRSITGFEDVSGWPFHALYLYMPLEQAPNTDPAAAIVFEIGDKPIILPLGIAWQGFIANVSIYAAGFAAIFMMLTFARRLARTRRGRCGFCGYDMRGHGDADRCPECGR